MPVIIFLASSLVADPAKAAVTSNFPEKSIKIQTILDMIERYTS